MIDNEERYGQEERREEGRQGLLIPVGWLLRWLWKRFRVIPLILLCAVSAHAIESICPTGASPRGDITWCSDAETACASESSDLCFTDNGFTSRDDHRGTDMMVVTDATKAVVGSRYYKMEGIVGGTGTGFATKTIANFSEMRIRWYQRFEQYQHYYHNHFLGISINRTGSSGGTLDCSRGATLEIGGQSSAYVYSTGSCGVAPASDNFYLNQGASATPQIKNNHWYLFEVAIKMDTSCSNVLLENGCNGEYKLWIDGTLVLSKTDINWGGVKNGATITSIDPVRNYRHRRNPVIPGKVLIDQIVVGNSASTAIGAATGATNLGTANATPYHLDCGIEPFYVNAGVSYSPESDWQPAPNSKIAVCGAPLEDWRATAGTASTTVYHTGIVTDTNATSDFGFSRPITEQSFRAQCTGANCGAGFLVPRIGGTASGNEGDGSDIIYENGALPQSAIHGWIYLPSTSVPNGLITYAGWAGDGTTAHSNFVGLSESSGKWAIMQRAADGTPAIVLTSNKTITRDAWHKFEIMIWDSEGVSLMIDDERLFDQSALPTSPTWMFDSAHNASHGGPVIGIIDYRGTGTVTAYYDDLSIGSTSFWSSDGWGSDSPFSSLASLKNWLRFRLRHWRQRH